MLIATDANYVYFFFLLFLEVGQAVKVLDIVNSQPMAL